MAKVVDEEIARRGSGSQPKIAQTCLGSAGLHSALGSTRKFPTRAVVPRYDKNRREHAQNSGLLAQRGLFSAAGDGASRLDSPGSSGAGATAGGVSAMAAGKGRLLRSTSARTLAERGVFGLRGAVVVCSATRAFSALRACLAHGASSRQIAPEMAMKRKSPVTCWMSWG